MSDTERDREIYINNPESFYTNKFFNKCKRIQQWQVPFAERISAMYGIESVVDFGCGCGFYLEGFFNSGARVAGYEYMINNASPYIPKIVRQYASYGNVMEKIDCGMFDLSMSVEVAEHILSEKSDMLVDNLTSSSNKYILFTAARKGQGGTAHINEQDSEFWIEKIENKGFRHSPLEINRIQNNLNDLPSSKYMRLIRKTIMFFVKENKNV